MLDFEGHITSSSVIIFLNALEFPHISYALQGQKWLAQDHTGAIRGKERTRTPNL